MVAATTAGDVRHRRRPHRGYRGRPPVQGAAHPSSIRVRRAPGYTPPVTAPTPSVGPQPPPAHANRDAWAQGTSPAVWGAPHTPAKVDVPPKDVGSVGRSAPATETIAFHTAGLHLTSSTYRCPAPSPSKGQTDM
ncbi:hypothetical protein MOPEL_003_01530 [Mobilicoccus pelagius NBRC 104925]|uniref:Uncharacterized protein n=1 Tax=Mobilicoccus pelagius NBRC 104925 TaxID=1089455 RepID=H5UN19_9MICO|nr:hypothetical protein MOPEL_003_01530 [Mobilicoccus pelagius NBRC 104925]